MSFSNRNEIVPIGQVIPTKEMQLKVLAAKKQECRSNIVRIQQEIEDLKIAKMAELEYQILHAQAELRQLEEHERKVKSSVDTQPQK